MATSPDYLRLAASAARALADTALDGLDDAVLVIDAQYSHLPIVLANAAARHCFGGDEASGILIETSLLRLLSGDCAAALDVVLTGLADSCERQVGWRIVMGDQTLMTRIRPLSSAPGHQLVLLSCRPSTAEPEVSMAIDPLPVRVMTLDTHLKVTHYNEAVAQDRASIDGALLGLSAFTLVPTSSVPPRVYARALEGHHYHDDALAVDAPGRPTRWFDIDIQPLIGSRGVMGLLILSVDVTQRRVQQRAQSSMERRLLALTEHARDIISIADPQGQLQYVSGGVRNSLGWTSQERESNFIFDHVHRDDLADLRAKFEQLIAGEIGSCSKEMRVRHKDGSYRWLESSFVSALDNPLIGGIVINSRDVTERKQAEFRLAQREEVFRLAADAVDGVIFEWDIMRGLVHRSRGVMEVLGLAPDEMEGSVDAWRERVHPRDFNACKRTVSLALLNQRGWTMTYRIRDAGGVYKSILERGLIQRNAAGDPVRAIGCCVDVSEIKRLTDILAETQRSAMIGGWEYSFASRQLTWTDEMFHIFDTNPKDFTVTWQSMLGRCVPECAATLLEKLTHAEASGDPLDLELEILTLKAERLWVRAIGHLELLDGKPLRAYGSVQNIQTQKVAQIALENSTDWLKLSMNMAHMHAWRWEKGPDRIEFATLEGTRHLLGRKPAMVKMLARVHPKDRKAVEHAIEDAVQRNVEVRQEFRLQGRDGRYRVYTTTARPLLEGTGKPRGLVGVLQDVTEQRESQRRLRESEELLQATTANTADTLFLVDAAFKVRFINKSMNGRTPDQIIGEELQTLLPESARVRVLEKLRHILEEGTTATYEFESAQGGRLQYFENRAVPVSDDVIGTSICISMRDITERKRMEQEILDVSGRERDRIGRDLHDGLGQELTGIALMLRGLAMRIQSRCPDVVDSIDEVVGLVNQSIENARSLARGLLPVRTQTGGLVAALRALAERSRDLYGLDVTFQSKVSAEPRLNETKASHVYRIAQEALTNAARHGRASRVELLLCASPTAFSLRIVDDGCGFTLPSQGPGMGLKIMKYRADIIGAKLELQANDPHGTIVKVTAETAILERVQST